MSRSLKAKASVQHGWNNQQIVEFGKSVVLRAMNQKLLPEERDAVVESVTALDNAMASFKIFWNAVSRMEFDINLLVDYIPEEQLAVMSRSKLMAYGAAIHKNALALNKTIGKFYDLMQEQRGMLMLLSQENSNGGNPSPVQKLGKGKE